MEISAQSMLLSIVVISKAYDGDIKDWNEIAKKIPGRNNKDCRKRFMNEVTGGLKKVRDLVSWLPQMLTGYLPYPREYGRKRKISNLRGVLPVTD